MKRLPPNKFVLINASNLHTGGGVQVAISFLQEAAQLSPFDFHLSVLASDEVAAGLHRLHVNCSVFDDFEVINTYGIRCAAPALLKRLQADAVFTIFGPLYLFPKPRLSIVGFAQPWIIYPRNEVYRQYSFLNRIRTKFSFILKKLAFSLGSDFVFVEGDHVRQSLVSEGVFKNDQIEVVPNCVSSFYLEPERWAGFSLPPRRGNFRLGVVSRDYLHKNLDIIPEVKAALLDDYGLDVEFIVTLKPEEWNRKSSSFQQAVLNVGALEVEQCPTFYQQLDGVFFPSLLECFSATPLEAMVMKKPLFASNRAFVRDFCAEFPWYFDPNSPNDAADVIAGFVRSGGEPGRIESAHQHVLSLPDANQRARAYLAKIRDILNSNSTS